MVKSAEGGVCWWAGKKKNWTRGRRAEQAGTRQHFQSNGCCSTSLSKVQNFSFDQLTHNHSEKGVPGNTVAAFPGVYSTKWPQLTLWPWLALCCTFFLAHYLFVGFILAVIYGTVYAGTAPTGHGSFRFGPIDLEWIWVILRQIIPFLRLSNVSCIYVTEKVITDTTHV